jgi:orotate phosphoribosyltransferase
MEALTTATQAELVARILVRTGAVSFRTDPFFRFTSGVESPIYVDNRRLLGFTAERRVLVSQLILALLRNEPPDALAGTATAGIAWAAWMADRLDLPMLYVRGQAKTHGKERAVEGGAPEGANVCVVEDLAFTAGSLVTATHELRAGGFEVSSAITLVTYEMPVGRARMDAAEVECTSLTTIDAALDVAVATRMLDDAQSKLVQEWLQGQRAHDADF